MNWKDCYNKKIVKNVNSDPDMIASLIKSSENKIRSEEKLTMNTITANSKISLAYDSLRELLEAVALKKGYKIYNHECYTAFIKEIIKESAKGDEFDEIRKVRNDINYYGKEISTEEAKNIIKRIKKLRVEILKLLKKQLIFSLS